MRAPVQAASIGAFSHETDVLVVGFGCAGGAAALEAREAGADVIVLERAGAAGGSSAMSGGELYLGGGTSVQEAVGFQDDADNMFAYLSAALGPHADEEKIRRYCDGSRDLFAWLEGLGLTFEKTFFDRPHWMPPTRDGLMWLGENAWPFNELARPVPRGHRPSTESFGGWLLMEKLVAAVSAAGVETHADTRATALVVDEGRVVGVTARHFGQDVTYRARRGVVLTTGGFADNEKMVADHAPALAGHGVVSDGGDDGSGIQMAAALGAATRRMNVTQIAFTAVPAMVSRGMLVNGHGKRFINEDGYPGRFSTAAFSQPGPVWAVVDERGFEEIAPEDLMGVRPQHAAETIEELEEDLGLPAGSLAATVATYNADAERGEDRLFHKDPSWLRPLVGPFAAVDARSGFFPGSGESAGAGTGFAGFTLGGLATTPDGQVLTVTDESLPGLYAAGRASSSMHGHGYVSGTSLADGLFFGRLAGRAAAG